MKKVVVTLIVILSVGLTYGQEKKCGTRSTKRFTKGFDIGINHANALLTDNSVATIQNGRGFRVGVISSLMISQRFFLEPKAELSFNTSTLTDASGERFKINPVDLEFIGHLRFKLRKGGFSPYILAGPNVKIPLGQGALTLPTRQDVAIDIGVGLDVPLFKWRIAPELRYSYGLKNITENASVGDVRFHNVSLILNLGGKH
ncbi:MAG: hypothetical protein ACI865_002838 [Flavobacteriaceae bacterium]|jgi:hypothetical protein